MKNFNLLNLIEIYFDLSSKLKDNIKNTQIKEMEIHMESYYQEVSIII